MSLQLLIIKKLFYIFIVKNLILFGDMIINISTLPFKNIEKEVKQELQIDAQEQAYLAWVESNKKRANNFYNSYLDNKKVTQDKSGKFVSAK